MTTLTAPLALTTWVLMLVSVPFWARPVPRSVKKISLADRCALISTVMNFKTEIHPGRFRVPFAHDPSVRQSAVWRGKPLVCAVLDQSGEQKRFPSPFFAQTESCDGDIAIYGPEAAKAADRPDVCVSARLQRNSSASFYFTLTLMGLRETGGFGIYPVDGVAIQEGGGWVVHQLFRPRPEGQ